MRIKLYILVLCLLLLATIISCATSGSRKPGGLPEDSLMLKRAESGGYVDMTWSLSGKIALAAWAQRPDGPLFLGDPDTGNISPVIHDGQQVFGLLPALSPSGKLLAYYDYGTDRTRILQLSAPFQEEMSLPYTGPVTWSPNEEYLAVITLSPDGEAVYRVTVRDHTVQQIFKVSDKRLRGHKNITWSPDGKRLAFTLGRETGLDHVTQFDVYILDLATEQTTQLTTSSTESYESPSWSPDSQRLLFVSRPITSVVGGQLTVAYPDGSCTKKILGVTGIDLVAWSPQGTRVAASDGNVYIFDLAPFLGGSSSKEKDCSNTK